MIDKITDEIAEIRENISILPHTKKADKKKTLTLKRQEVKNKWQQQL